MSGAGCSWSHTLKEWERRPGKVNWSRIQYYCKSEKRGNTAPQKERGSEWNTSRLSWAGVSWLTLQSNVVASPLQLPFLHFFFSVNCCSLGLEALHRTSLTAHDFPISFWDCLSGPWCLPPRSCPYLPMTYLSHYYCRCSGELFGRKWEQKWKRWSRNGCSCPQEKEWRLGYGWWQYWGKYISYWIIVSLSLKLMFDLWGQM